MKTHLLVNEVFHSIQGEGYWAGTPAIFIRLQGCTVGCPWCDTGYALGLRVEDRLSDNDLLVFCKTDISSAFTLAQETWLVQEVLVRRGLLQHVVLTGGEPCAQPIMDLTRDLLQAGMQVQIETSGTCPIECAYGTWVTLSPKAKPVMEANWSKADEIKLPVRTMEDVQRHAGHLASLPAERIRLQPVNQESAATALCVRLCMERNWRLSLQTHKYINLR